jgi:hypothetical protein
MDARCPCISEERKRPGRAVVEAWLLAPTRRCKDDAQAYRVGTLKRVSGGRSESKFSAESSDG